VREWEEAKREHEQGGGCVRALGSRASPSAGSFALQRVGTLLTWNLASCSWARYGMILLTRARPMLPCRSRILSSIGIIDSVL